MIGALLVFLAFAYICFSALRKPWIGIVGFYFFVVLDPGWNWRWAIPSGFPFQPCIAGATMVGWAIAGFPIKQLTRQSIKPVLGLVAFLALAFLSAAQSIDPELSSSYMRNMWRIVLITILAVLLIDTPKKISVLMIALVVAQAYNAFQINLQYFQDGFSRFAAGGWSAGAKGDNNVFTIFTLPVIAMTLGCFVSSKRLLTQSFTFGVLVLQIHQTMLLESRGGMLGILAMGCVFVFFAPKTPKFIGGCLLVLIAGGFLAGPSVVREFSSIFESREGRDSSAESRTYLWKAGFEITKDYPLLGVGPWAGSRLVPAYYEGELVGRFQERKELHNLVFETSTGCGVPATAAYFFFFFAPWMWCTRGLWRKRIVPDDPHLFAGAISVAAGVPGYMVASMFSSGALMESSYVLSAIGIAVACWVWQKEQSARRISRETYVQSRATVPGY